MLNIKLSWDDNSSIEDSFVVQRLNGGIWETIGSVEKNQETFTDPSAEINRSYTYRVMSSLFNNNSEPSNEFTISPLGIAFSANPSEAKIISITKTGDLATWIEPDRTATINNELEADQSGQHYLVLDSKSSVTTIQLDDLGIVGEIDLSGGYSSLDNFSAINNNLNLIVDAAFIQRQDVSIDVTNSFAQNDTSKLSTLIDRILVANGGDTTDDGTDYIGNAGNNFTGRTLTIGTLVTDLTISSDRILFQKIAALESVGWNVNTVKTLCNQVFEIDTQGEIYAVTPMQEFTEIVESTRVTGSSLLLDIYDSEANALNGVSTGKLNSISGQAGVNDWALNYTWGVDETVYIRFYAVDGLTVQNESLVTIKAYPTDERPCGSVVDVTTIPSAAIYSTRFKLQAQYQGDFYEVDIDNNLIAWKNQTSLSDLVQSSDNALKVISDIVNNSSNLGRAAYNNLDPYGFEVTEFSFFCRFRVVNDNNSAAGIFSVEQSINGFNSIKISVFQGDIIIDVGQSINVLKQADSSWTLLFVTYSNGVFTIYEGETEILSFNLSINNFTINYNRIYSVGSGNRPEVEMTDAGVYLRIITPQERSTITNLIMT